MGRPKKTRKNKEGKKHKHACKYVYNLIYIAD